MKKYANYLLDRRVGSAMATLRERIASLVKVEPGLTDREITNRLLGHAAPQQGVNQTARAMTTSGQIIRQTRNDGKIGNYPVDPAGDARLPNLNQGPTTNAEALTEDDVKRKLQGWLESNGWKVTVAWGRSPGVDLEARRGTEHWIIEAKGRGSRDAMRVNYFLAILGELLQRMKDPDASHSIALPDIPQFRRLWDRLPRLAKSRTCISALFVADSGQVQELP